ncbi:hypothetical protein BJ973_002269 [Actinoplanes tereljensis]|uniref:TIR domain-containing protein n=1 Tax=Paractinoplanes tereljensis TaxID=571912 RepID=A0A919NPH7_9ACTN|nr:toll/interleukin-1 receptor domain-containing protein [Actinoplanes tereljensis]GIF21943.1 hypothetical protein Ate02nite_46730 [Actinoplanes tereljensis]
MAQAFLSYSSQDSEMAGRLVTDLRKAGLQIWYDADILAGQRWEPLIADQLERADAVIVLISPASLVSKWVRHEWDTALGRSARVIPVLVNGVTTGELPEELHQLQAVRLTEEDYFRGLRRLVDSVNALGASTALPPPTAGVDVERLVDDAVSRIVERLESAGPATSSVLSDSPPTVTSEPRDDGLVFVICSFAEDMTPAYEAIAEAAKAVGLRAERVKDVPGDYRITDKMLAMIRQARLVVADLTLERPNVYFELGYARALGRQVITIARKGTKVHFDAADWPYISYIDSRPLERQLATRFEYELGIER